MSIINEELKCALKGLSLFLIFMVYQIFGLRIFKFLGFDIANASIFVKSLISLVIQFFLIFLFIYINLNDIKRYLKDFLTNKNTYFKKYFKFWLLSLGLVMITNLIIMLFLPNSLPNNETAIRKTLETAPIYIYISAVIIAPILEELVFRKGFRMAISNNIIYILTSGLVFGSLHVIGSLKNLYELVYIIPYSIPGFIFAYVYIKSKNIMVPITLHFIHNGILMSLQIFILLFG
ncbi:MAG TPA: CPBP family intramembrane metalloprotease [Tenericutes bacterium]|nr:CPBP family intramembrane metalloprotease [Mycoplasmatota bacterium]